VPAKLAEALVLRRGEPLAEFAGGGSYGVLYTVAGLCAITGAVAILPVRRVR
jgi:hypothetical protein